MDLPDLGKILTEAHTSLSNPYLVIILAFCLLRIVDLISKFQYIVVSSCFLLYDVKEKYKFKVYILYMLSPLI